MIGCVVQDAKVGTEIFSAYAESRNYGQQTITYTLIDTGGGQDFRVDPTTGQVLTSATLNYDRARDYLVMHAVGLSLTD